MHLTAYGTFALVSVCLLTGVTTLTGQVFFYTVLQLGHKYISENPPYLLDVHQKCANRVPQGTVLSAPNLAYSIALCLLTDDWSFSGMGWEY